MSFPTAQLIVAERAIRDSWPATVYVAAFVAGVEQTANGWARVAVVVATVFPNADPLVSAADISFPIVSVATDDVDQVKIYSASSGGTLLGTSDTFAQTDVAANGQLRLPAAGVEIRVA